MNRRAWDEASRLLAIGALLRDLGYAAVPFGDRGHPLLGVPTSDVGLNACTATTTFSRTGATTADSEKVTWLLWDGRAPLGQCSQAASGGKLVRGLSVAAVLDGPRSKLTFADFRLPAFVLTRRRPFPIEVGTRQP